MPSLIKATVDNITQLVSPKKRRGKRTKSKKPTSSTFSPRLTRLQRAKLQQQPPAPHPPTPEPAVLPPTPEPAVLPPTPVLSPSAKLNSPQFNMVNFNPTGKGSPYPATTILDEDESVPPPNTRPVDTEERVDSPPVRPTAVEELFDDPPPQPIIDLTEEDEPSVQVSDSDDGSLPPADVHPAPDDDVPPLDMPPSEFEAEEDEDALRAEAETAAAAQFPDFNAKPAARSCPPRDDSAERVVKSRIETKLTREVSNHSVGDPMARKVIGWCFVEHWIDLRAGQDNQEWVVVKKNGEIVLSYRPMPFDRIHLSYSGNAGEQLMVKADVYDESRYAEDGMKVWGVRGKRVFFEFETKTQYDCFLVAHTVSDGPKFIEEWYNKEGRFFQPPHKNPFQVFNPDGMEVDELNGHRIEEREPPLNEDEIDDEFDDYQPMSQAW